MASETIRIEIKARTTAEALRTETAHALAEAEALRAEAEPMPTLEDAFGCDPWTDGPENWEGFDD